MARLSTILFAMLLILGACSSGSDTGGTTVDAGSTTSAPASGATSSEATQPPAAPAATQPPVGSTEQAGSSTPEASAGEAGTATLTLENGDVFDFSVDCVIGPVDAGMAGRDLLVSVESNENAEFYITAELFGPDQYGSGPLSIIQVWSTLDNAVAWGAYSANGTPIDLRVDGNTVTGSATFGDSGDPTDPIVPGEFVAYC